MSPLEISMLIHYHVSPTDFRDGDFHAPAVREFMDRFKSAGFLRLSTNEDDVSSIYLATDKTHAFVRALCEVPEPVQRWIVPPVSAPGAVEGER